MSAPLPSCHQPVKISVIIPVINEVAHLSGAVQSAWKAGADEVIVADGGSSDGTVEKARALSCRLVETTAGRGPQQNAGAAAASGEVLLFLHADARLSPACDRQLHEAFSADPHLVGGGFEQEIRHPSTVYRWLERGNAARVRWQQLIYGDQGLFVRRAAFQRVGGFPEFPLMEDFEISRRLRKIGRLILLPGPITISARRWEKHGVIRQTARNWTLATLYRCGASPFWLARQYRRHDRPASGDPPQAEEDST